MDKTNTIFAIILFAMAGCIGKKQSTDALITVDVSANYPTKELILQDFMDVEYIALETTDEFLCRGFIRAIGKEIMLVARGGDILFFDRNGKAIRKINRQGRGSEEYLSLMGNLILDEDNDEIFVNDFSGNKIIVYDLFGKFKRSFPHNDEIRYQSFYNFDGENLICDDMNFRVEGDTPDKSPFIVISKQNGSLINDIQIPYKQKKTTMISRTVEVNGTTMSVGSAYRYFSIIPYHGGCVLTEPSSDTIFKIAPDYSMIPLIVRTPSVQSMNPEVFLLPRMLTDRFFFMETFKKEEDPTVTNLAYDLQEKAIYEYTLCNGDYSTKKMVEAIQKNVSDGIIFWQEIAADELVESYKKGELKGNLKDIAAGLEEDSNPVIMLVKHKK
jgi:hypothetical protein